MSRNGEGLPPPWFTADIQAMRRGRRPTVGLKPTVVAAIAFAIAGCHHATVVESAAVTTAQRQSAEQFVDSLATAQHLPGFAVTVSIGRRVVFERGVGYSDIAARIPATSATRFRIGSVSKLLTATALLRLAQTGRLDLDAPVAQYLTVPAAVGAATLRQVAGHLGGVRHYRGTEFLTNTHYDRLADAIAIFANDSLVAPPGTRYSYSSYGYNMLGAVIEQATGTGFNEALRLHVLDRLGLHATVPDIKGARIPDRARLYRIVGDTLAEVPEDDLSGRWPSGGYLSSTSDLARFGRSILTPGLLNAVSLQTMLTPQRLNTGATTSVGIGWRIGHDSIGRQYVHHGGSSNGGSAFLLVYPRERLVVAMASNALGQWSEREAVALARYFLQ
jgi:serine beta-lactamase-like protein LACTB